MAEGNRTGPALVPHDMGGHEIQRVQCSLLTPLANGAASSGASHEIADALHVHPSTSGPDPTPVGVSTKLWTGVKLDGFRRPDVRALSALGMGYGLSFSDDWEAHGAGVARWWSKRTADPVLGYGASANFPLAATDRFAVINTEAVAPTQTKYSGIYELMAQGDGVSQVAVIRRAADANTAAGLCSGMVFKVVGEGAAFQGSYFHLTTDDPITPDDTSLTIVEFAYADPVAYELLTGPQLATEGVSNEALHFETTLASGTGDFVEAEVTHSFVSLVGTPGAESLAAGDYGINVEDAHTSWFAPGPTPGSITTLRAKLLDIDTGNAEILVAESPNLAAVTVEAPLFMQATLAAAYAFSVSKRLRLAYFIRTNSTVAITLHLRYNSAARGTWLQLPFQMVGTGGSTGRHQDLTGCDQDVASTDPAKAIPCHPFDAIGAGRLHPGIDYATISGAGIVAFPAHRSQARAAAVATLTTLNGIDTTGFLDGDPLMLYLNSTPSNVYELVHNATVAAPALPFSLQTLDGVGQKLTCDQPATLEFWLDMATQCFRLKSAMM